MAAPPRGGTGSDAGLSPRGRQAGGVIDGDRAAATRGGSIPPRGASRTPGAAADPGAAGRPRWDAVALDVLAERLAEMAPARLGLAVSGGSDSTALLMAAIRSPSIHVRAATVDHRLRPDSALEAAKVADLCRRLGVPHDTLIWREAPGRGNLAEAARHARAALLADWARDRGLDAVALGHTRDDQAETLLLRLARGTGLDGLAAMRPRSERIGMVWLRPALALGREDLRGALRAQRVDWVDDPSNEDLARDRPRVRAALATLAPLGLNAAGLADTADRLAEDADHLRAEAGDLLRRIASIGAAGEVRLDRIVFREAPRALRRRALALLSHELAGGPHPPRRAALARIEDACDGPADMSARSLGGLLFSAVRTEILVHREPAALPPPAPTVWDGRWRLPGPGRIGALGERGLAELNERGHVSWAEWRAAPRAARLASPARRVDGVLAAAPLAGFGPTQFEDRLARRLGLAPARSGHGAAR